MYKKEILLDAYIGKKSISMNAEIRNRAGGADFFIKHDISLLGNGNTIPLGVNTDFVATKEDLKIKANKATTLAGYGITDAYTKEESDAKFGSVYHAKGSVQSYNDLPDNPETGDVYNVLDTGANYVWTGEEWDKLSETIDLTNYATKAEVNDKLSLNGGTLTGPLEINAIGGSTTLLTLSYKATETSSANSWGFYLGTNMLNLSYNGTGFYTFSPLHVSPAGNGIRDLGQSYAKWKTLYATKLNNGADIAVPTTGGTMALEPNVVALSESTVELATNTIYNAGEMATLAITFPTADETYVSQLNFTSGATATAFTAPDTIKWVGDDVTDGAFIPATNKRYAIMFYSDGTNIRGAVQGVA